MPPAGRLEHGLGQLLDEQGHAVGPIRDLIGDLLRQGLAAGDLRDHLGAEPARQAMRLISVTCERPIQRPPEGDHRQQRQARRRLDDQVEQFERRGIGPMRASATRQHLLMGVIQKSSAVSSGHLWCQVPQRSSPLRVLLQLQQSAPEIHIKEGRIAFPQPDKVADCAVPARRATASRRLARALR